MIPGDTVDDMLSSLKLCSASSNRSALKSLNGDQAVTSDASKQNCPRSMSLSELNLEPDDQDDYICEFFLPFNLTLLGQNTMCETVLVWQTLVTVSRSNFLLSREETCRRPSCQLGSSSEGSFSFIKASAGQSAASKPLNCFFRAGCY
jgi:hypothetical protein